MKTKRCQFCRVGLDRHVAILWENHASACVTLPKKLTDEVRKEYWEKFKPFYREWWRVFGGEPKD